MKKKYLVGLVAGMLMFGFGQSSEASQFSPFSLYGITSTDLILINPGNISDKKVVVSHDLANYGLSPYNLTYHPGVDSFFGFALDGSDNSFLFKVERTSGNTSIVSSLGHGPTQGCWDALEYVDGSRNTLIGSHATGSNWKVSNSLYSIDVDGTSTFLFDTGLNNDYAVYNPIVIGDGLFVGDPNGPGQHVAVDLGAQTTVNVGAIPYYLGDVAFSSTDSAMYGIEWEGDGMFGLYKIMVNPDGTPGNSLMLGDMGIEVKGLSYAPSPVPIPGALWLLGSGLAGLVSIQRKKK